MKRIALSTLLAASALVATASPAFASTTPIGPGGLGAITDVTGNYQLIINGIAGPVFHATSNPEDTVFRIPVGTQVVVFGFAPDGTPSSCLGPNDQKRHLADPEIDPHLGGHEAVCQDFGDAVSIAPATDKMARR